MMTMSPYTYIAELESMRTGGEVCQLTVSDTPISMPCLISSFKFGEKDGSGDVYYELALTEYRYVTAAETGKTDPATGLKKRPESFWQKMKKNITYYPGDSIGNVVGRAVGNRSRSIRSSSPSSRSTAASSAAAAYRRGTSFG